MSLSLITRRWQQRVIVVLVGLSPVLIWRPIQDGVGLPKATLTVVACIAVLTLGALRAAAERRLLLPQHPLAWAAVAFAGAMVVATLFSMNRAVSIVGDTEFYAGLIGTVACMAIALVVARVLDERWTAWLLGSMVAGATVVALYAVVQRADADPLTWSYNANGFVFSTMGNPNFVAAVLGIAAPVAAGLALLRSWPIRLRIVSAGAAIICLGGALATTSFQGVAAGAAGLVVVSVAFLAANRSSVIERWGLQRIVAAGVVGLVVLGALALASVNDVGAAVDSGLDERTLIWRTAADVIGDHPIVGTGPDTFGQVFLRYRPAEHAVKYFYTRADQAHDVPLNMFATGGVLLGVTYLAVVALTALALVRGIRTATGDRAVLLAAAGGGWVAYHVQSLVSLDTPTLLLWHWVLTALVFVLALDPPFAEYVLPGGVPASTKPSKRQRLPRPNNAVLSVIVVLGVVGAWFATRPLRAELAIERARQSANRGDADAALGEIDKATRLAGWSATAWSARAQLQEAHQDVFEAAASGARAARRDKGSPSLAVIAARLTQSYLPREANPWWEDAVRRDPNNPTLLAEVARGLVVVRPDRAEELARRGAEIDPQSAEALAALGDVLRAGGDEDGAREAYEQSVAIAPDGSGAAGIAALDEESTDG